MRSGHSFDIFGGIETAVNILRKNLLDMRKLVDIEKRQLSLVEWG
jgi:hypothetical protein